MNKIFSIILLAGGCILIAYGLKASESADSGLSRLFTGTPSDKTIWLLIGGGISAVAGLGGLITGRKP